MNQKHRNKGWLAILLLVISVLSGCHPTQKDPLPTLPPYTLPSQTTEIVTQPVTEEPTQEPATEFDLTQVTHPEIEGHRNLYYLNSMLSLNPTEETVSYSSQYPQKMMGKNTLLLFGVNYIDNGWDYYDTENYYSLYDLEKNAITRTEFIEGDVNVGGNFLFSYRTEWDEKYTDVLSNKLVIYDANLEICATYILEQNPGYADFYSGESLFPMYCEDFGYDKIYELTPDGDTLRMKELVVPGYRSSINDISASGDVLMLSVVNRENFRRENIMYRVSSGEYSPYETDYTKDWIESVLDPEGEFYYIESAFAYDETHYLLYLYGKQEEGSIFALWDASETIATGNTPAAYASAIADGRNDEWLVIPEGSNPAYEDLYAQAEAIGNQYGIKIFIGDRVPADISEFHVVQQTNAEDIERSLHFLEKNLSLYPKNFLPQLLVDDMTELDIFLTDMLTSEAPGMLSQAGGFATRIGTHRLLVLDCSDSLSLYDKLHHEIYHLIDSRLSEYSTYAPDALYSYANWDALNPEGFEYVGNYETYTDYYDLYNTYADYFVSFYSINNGGEDRAEIFGSAMYDYCLYMVEDMEEWGYIEVRDREYIRAKMQYICDTIRESFNTTGWDDVLPWEYYLQQSPNNSFGKG